MGKILFNFNFYKKPISFVFLAIFLVGIFFNLALIPKTQAAENTTKYDNNLKYNPKNFYYVLSKQNNDAPEIILRWEAPPNINDYFDLKKYGSIKKANVEWRISVTNKDDGKKIYEEQLADILPGSDELKGVVSQAINQKDAKELDWGKNYSVVLEAVDYNISKTEVIGRATTDVFMDSGAVNIKASVSNGNCPPQNLIGWVEHYENYDMHNLHLRWEYNYSNDINSCHDDNIPSMIKFKVEPDKNGKINLNNKYNNGAKKDQIYHQFDTGETDQNLEGTYKICTINISTGNEIIGCSEITIDSSVITSAVGGDPGDNDPSGSNPTDDDKTFCKKPLGLGSSISYAICWLGEKLINFLEDSVLSGLINTFNRLANISSDNSGEDSYLLEQIKEDNIKEAWNYVITIVDALIVMILLVASFANILRVQLDTYAVKKLLPGLITGIIAAHFSYFIIYILLDLNAVIATQAITWAGGVDKMSNAISSGISGFGALKGIAFVNFFVAILMIIPIVLFIMLILLMIARIFMILILTMFSPIALIAMGVPQFSHYFKSWWQQIINWVFMPTVVFIILGAGTRFITPKSVTISESSLFSFEVLGGWVISVLLLYLAYKIPMKSMGGSVGNMISSTAKSFGTKVNETGGMAKDLGLRKLYEYGTDFDDKDNPDTGKKKFARFLATGGAMTSQRYWKKAAEERKKLNEKNIQEFEKNAMLTTPGIKQLAGDDAIRRQEIDRKMEIDEYKSEEQLRREQEKDKNRQKFIEAAAEQGVKDEMLEDDELKEIKGKTKGDRATAIEKKLQKVRAEIQESRTKADSLKKQIQEKQAKNLDVSSEQQELEQLKTRHDRLMTQKSVLSGADAWMQKNVTGSPVKFLKTSRELGINPSDAAVVRSGLINLAKKERSKYRRGEQSMFELAMDPANYESGGRTAFFGGDGDIDSISYKGQPITTAMTIDHIDIDPAEKDKIRKSLSLGTRLDESWSRRTASEIARKTGETQEQAMTRLASTQRRELAKNDSLYLKRAKERLSSSGLDDSEYDSIKTALSRGDFNPQEALKTLQTNVSTLRTQGADAEVVQKTIDTLQSSGAVSPISMSEFKTNDAQAAEALSRFAEKRAKALEAVLTAHAQVHPNQAINAESLGQISNEAIQDALAQQEKINIQIEDAISKASEMKQGGGNSEDLQAQLAQIAFSQNVEVSPAQMQTITQNITKHLDTGDRAVITQQISEEFNKIKQSASVQGSYNPNDQTTPNNEGTPFDPSK